jgi:hypothetical protein
MLRAAPSNSDAGDHLLPFWKLADVAAVRAGHQLDSGRAGGLQLRPVRLLSSLLLSHLFLNFLLRVSSHLLCQPTGKTLYNCNSQSFIPKSLFTHFPLQYPEANWRAPWQAAVFDFALSQVFAVCLAASHAPAIWRLLAAEFVCCGLGGIRVFAILQCL